MMINAHAAAATVARHCDRQTDRRTGATESVKRKRGRGRGTGWGTGYNVYQYSWHSLLILTEAKLMSLLCM